MLYLFEQKPPSPAFDWQAVVEPAKDEKAKEERALFCRVCHHLITSPKERITVEGRHLYRFSNPHGIVFEIGCFGHAEGCRPEGPPEEYWSWFPDYAWQIQRCAQCLSHLGWRYSKADHAFYGLVLPALLEGFLSQ